MEILLDILLLLTALAAIVAGWRRGAVLTALPVVGLVGGLWLGLTLAPPIVTWLASLGWNTAVERTITAAGVMLLCAAVLYGLAATIAAMIRRTLRKGVARGVDAAGGAAVGLVAWMLVVWLLAGFLQTTNLLGVQQVIASSRVVAALQKISPIPASSALGAMDDVLAAAGLPKVFTGGEVIRPAAPPDSSVPSAINRAAGSVVKIFADEPRCGTASEGSGWVVSSGRVVTNAHVVAGSSTVRVQAGGVGYAHPARLVAFDPGRDLAVLDVPGLDAPALKTGPDASTGAPVYAAGYPESGAYHVSPARVRQILDATGTDIYHEKTVTREIYSLRGVVRPGNSGGPLLDANGRVVGVVFARSTTDPDTGYALTLDEVRPVLAKAGSSAAVSSGRCTSH